VNYLFKWTFTVDFNECRIKLSKGPDRIHLVRNLKIEKKSMSELLNNLTTADIVILVIFSTVG